MNRIYFFTGTGNSLVVAEAMAKELSDCEVVAIKKGMDMTIPSGYERIGFVFPVYYWGLPVMVARFLSNAEFPESPDTYYFAAATCGGIVGNSLRQTSMMLYKKGIHLNYSAPIRMFKNAVTVYDMSKKVDSITISSDKRALPVIYDIKNKNTNKTPFVIKPLYRLYLKSAKTFKDYDRDFNINDDCISCGICRDVCPAQNITLEDGTPVYHHHCECCLACIHHCPKRAINYKDKTQSRGRYTHPRVGHRVISKYYKA